MLETAARRSRISKPPVNSLKEVTDSRHSLLLKLGPKSQLYLISSNGCRDFSTAINLNLAATTFKVQEDEEEVQTQEAKQVDKFSADEIEDKVPRKTRESQNMKLIKAMDMTTVRECVCVRSLFVLWFVER